MNFRHIAGSSAIHRGLRFTADGNAFIRCLNNAAVIQSLVNPTQQQILRGHEARVSCIDVQGNLLLSGEEGVDSDVILWDITDGRIIQRFSEHDGGIYEVSFSQDGLFYSTLGQDGMIYIIEIASGDIVGKLNTNFIRCKFGPRIKDPRGFQLAQYYLLAVSSDGSLQKVVWVPETGQISTEGLVQTGTKRFASDITFLESRNGYFAASCTCGDVLIGDLRKAEIVQVIQVRGQGSKLNVCKCFPRVGQTQQQSIYQTYNKNQLLDERIAVGGTGIFTILRGTGAGTWETALELRFEDDLSSVDVDYRGQVICEATNGLVNILTPQTEYQPVTISQSHTAPITDLRFIGDRIVALCTRNNQLRVVDLTDYMPALNIPTGRRANESYPSAVQINVIQLVTGFSNGDVIIFDVETGEVLLELKGADRAKINSISCQGQRIVVAGDAGEIRHWDIKARSILEHIQTHQLPINQVVLQKDLNGQPLTLSCADDRYIVCQVNGVRLLDFQTNGPVRGFVQFQGLFAAISGYQVLLLDLKENKVIDVLEMKNKLTCCCSVGDQMLVGDESGSLYYIAINNGKFSIQHEKINVHGSPVWKVAEQGGVIASADLGGELIVWE